MSYPVVFLFAGLVISAIVDRRAAFVPSLFALLPALLFEAAWNLSRESVRRVWFPSLVLAFPGVIATSLLVAAVVAYIAHVSWSSALIFGAIVSATDPIAVVSIVRKLNAPEQLRTIVEVESLVNDGVAAVLYTVMVAGVAGTQSGLLEGFKEFFLMTLGGALIGYAFAQLAAIAVRRFHHAWLHIGVTVALAYGAFALAQSMSLSGIIAAIVAAYVLGTQELTLVDVRMHESVDRFWTVIAVVANAAVFLAMGVAISLRELALNLRFVGSAVLAVMFARVVLLGALLPMVVRLPRGWSVPLIFAGMRGALSLALAMSLPPLLPDRTAIIDAVAGVVIVTILVPAGLIAPWLRRFPPAAAS